MSVSLQCLGVLGVWHGPRSGVPLGGQLLTLGGSKPVIAHSRTSTGGDVVVLQRTRILHEPPTSDLQPSHHDDFPPQITWLHPRASVNTRLLDWRNEGHAPFPARPDLTR
jgi:hypothetical protein